MHVEVQVFVDALRSVIPIAEIYAASTASKWDDATVALAKAILANEALIGWIKAIFENHEVQKSSGPARSAAIQAAAMASMTPEVKQALESAGVSAADPQVWIDRVRAIVSLILSWFGLRS